MNKILLTAIFLGMLFCSSKVVADNHADVGRYTIVQDTVTGNAYLLDTSSGAFKHIPVINYIWQQPKL